MSGADYNTFSPTPGFFDGAPVLNTDIVVKYTYSGDINLDGLVNDDDFGVFSGNYFFTPATTLSDLASLSAPNRSIPVPEPASLLLLGFAGAGFLTRRKRSRSMCGPGY